MSLLKGTVSCAAIINGGLWFQAGGGVGGGGRGGGRGRERGSKRDG